jgi:hypothetical protein
MDPGQSNPEVVALWHLGLIATGVLLFSFLVGAREGRWHNIERFLSSAQTDTFQQARNDLRDGDYRDAL